MARLPNSGTVSITWVCCNNWVLSLCQDRPVRVFIERVRGLAGLTHESFPSIVPGHVPVQGAWVVVVVSHPLVAMFLPDQAGSRVRLHVRLLRLHAPAHKADSLRNGAGMRS